MLEEVQVAGFRPCLIAAFSAGKPKASKPQVSFYKEKNRFVLFIERLLDRYVKRY